MILESEKTERGLGAGRQAAESTSGQAARTINELFSRAMDERVGRIVMRHKRGKEWVPITGDQLNERVRNLAVALQGLGIRAGDRVALLAESCPDWSIVDYAILATGAVNVPIYPTQAVDQVAFILKNSGAKALFVSNARQLRRIQSALDSLAPGERPQ
ncbi:MAG TPA: AMP-binding protein, partial [Terriglobia bacterium]|nr:AMP-binding protein [Terriglobia bacterium]